MSYWILFANLLFLWETHSILAFIEIGFCKLSDEDIPSVSTTSPIEDVAVQDNSKEVRLGPMTRSRTKLIEQQVNSLLADCDNLIDENFILPKSMHLCVIRFVDNISIMGEEEQQ